MRTNAISRKISSWGFSLIESMLVIAILGIVFTISLPFYQSWQISTQFDNSVQELAESIQRAQLKAAGIEFNDSWSVKITANQIVIFKGANYSSRDTSYDEIFSIPATITPSGLTEINFDKMTGNTQDTGTITLQSSNGQSQNISINAQGEVSY